MITIKDLKRTNTAILENAYEVGYNKKNNVLDTASFNMPSDDVKNEKIKSMHYAEIIDDDTDEYIGLYRILPQVHSYRSTSDYRRYNLEHVLGTLLGVTMYKYHQFQNYTTREVLTRLLNMQHTKHWVLGDVEFTRYFHYSWENENLLSAILSVPKSFDVPYIWETDTTSYPWTLHLRKPKTHISTRIVDGHNLKGFTMEEDPGALYNRIYPLGSGEGVNQLDITKVNNGIPYLENVQSIAKYGLYEYTWADRRFEDAESLKKSAQALIDKWSVPKVSWTANVSDVSHITGIKADKIRKGSICQLNLEGYGPIELQVLEESKDDIFENKGDLEIVLGNKLDDLGTTQTDLERRQQINELYSQGATNILNFSYQDNCDKKRPATIPFYIDDDVVNINSIELTFRTKRFRAYSGITEGGGGVVKSTSSGGGTTRSTTSGGSVSTSTASGGSSTRTSSSAGESTRTSSSGGAVSTSTQSGGAVGTTSTGSALYNNVYSSSEMGAKGTTAHYHMIAGEHLSHSHGFSIGSHSHGFSIGNHTHTLTIPAHTHTVSIPSHTHSFEIPNHSHDVTIPNHSHEIDIPDHTHDIIHEIVEAPTSASSVGITVDGNPVPHTSTSGDRINLAKYMNKNNDGIISRGRHEITITPNALARIEADVILRVFIRSQIGGVM